MLVSDNHIPEHPSISSTSLLRVKGLVNALPHCLGEIKNYKVRNVNELVTLLHHHKLFSLKRNTFQPYSCPSLHVSIPIGVQGKLPQDMLSNYW